jgi:hypothetical protein
MTTFVTYAKYYYSDRIEVGRPEFKLNFCTHFSPVHCLLHASCPLNLTILITFIEEYKLSSSIYSVFPSLPMLPPHIPISTLFSSTHILLVWSCQIICPSTRPFVTFRKMLIYYSQVLLASRGPHRVLSQLPSRSGGRLLHP